MGLAHPHGLFARYNHDIPVAQGNYSGEDCIVDKLHIICSNLLARYMGVDEWSSQSIELYV